MKTNRSSRSRPAGTVAITASSPGDLKAGKRPGRKNIAIRFAAGCIIEANPATIEPGLPKRFISKSGLTTAAGNIGIVTFTDRNTAQFPKGSLFTTKTKSNATTGPGTLRRCRGTNTLRTNIFIGEPGIGNRPTNSFRWIPTTNRFRSEIGPALNV